MGQQVQIQNSYLKYYLVHIIIGVIIFSAPFLSKLYSPIILLFGIFAIHKKQNKNHEALLISAYVVGVEVFLRMTDGMYFNEYGKYSIIIFMIMIGDNIVQCKKYTKYANGFNCKSTSCKSYPCFVFVA